jgi:hypothetical protein
MNKRTSATGKKKYTPNKKFKPKKRKKRRGSAMRNNKYNPVRKKR